MSPVLMIVWEGLAFEALRPWIVEGKLPNLASLIQEGAHGVLRRATPIENDEASVFWQLLRDAGRRVISLPAEGVELPARLTLEEARTSIREKAAAARRLMQSEPWDCSRITFCEPSRHEPADDLRCIYQELDRQIEAFTLLLSTDATLVILAESKGSELGIDSLTPKPPNGGLLVVCGATVRAHIEVTGRSVLDLFAMVLRLLDVPLPPDMAGQTLEIFSSDAAEDDEAIIAERLRSLGYLD